MSQNFAEIDGHITLLSQNPVQVSYVYEISRESPDGDQKECDEVLDALGV